MDTELLTMLRGFLAGTISRRDLARFVESLDIWNGWQDADEDIEALRDVVGDLDLVLTDVAEGYRDGAECHDLAERFVRQAEQTSTVQASAQSANP